MIKILCLLVLLLTQASIAQIAWPSGSRDRGGASGRYPQGGEDDSAREARTKPKRINTIRGFTHPESTLVTNTAIFVSDMGQDTSSRKKDGQVYKFSLDGELDTNFDVREKLISPMGMTIIDQILFVVDEDKVIALSSINGSKLREYDFSIFGATFLNDIVSVEEQYLFVTATNLKKIFIIDTNTGFIKESGLDLKGTAPNGIAYDSYRSRIYVSGNRVHELGENGNGVVFIYQFNKSTHSSYIEKYIFIGKFLDGIAIKGRNLVVSDWMSRKNEGTLYYLNRITLRLNMQYNLFVSGLADISYSENPSLLLVPSLTEGLVHIYKQ